MNHFDADNSYRMEGLATGEEGADDEGEVLPGEEKFGRKPSGDGEGDGKSLSAQRRWRMVSLSAL